VVSPTRLIVMPLATPEVEIYVHDSEFDAFLTRESKQQVRGILNRGSSASTRKGSLVDVIHPPRAPATLPPAQSSLPRTTRSIRPNPSLRQRSMDCNLKYKWSWIDHSQCATSPTVSANPSPSNKPSSVPLRDSKCPSEP
jgi:hypothetical protein